MLSVFYFSLNIPTVSTHLIDAAQDQVRKQTNKFSLFLSPLKETILLLFMLIFQEFKEQLFFIFLLSANVSARKKWPNSRNK